MRDWLSESVPHGHSFFLQCRLQGVDPILTPAAVFQQLVLFLNDFPARNHLKPQFFAAFLQSFWWLLSFIHNDLTPK